MRFLADVGVSPVIVRWLREQGHDVLSLLETSQHRLPDETIHAMAIRDSRIIVTFDLDFADLASAAHEGLASVVLFRLNNPRSAVALRRLSETLPAIADRLLAGAVAVIEPARVGIRSLPLR